MSLPQILLRSGRAPARLSSWGQEKSIFCSFGCIFAVFFFSLILVSIWVVWGTCSTFWGYPQRVLEVPLAIWSIVLQWVPAACFPAAYFRGIFSMFLESLKCDSGFLLLNSSLSPTKWSWGRNTSDFRVSWSSFPSSSHSGFLGKEPLVEGSKVPGRVSAVGLKSLLRRKCLQNRAGEGRRPFSVNSLPVKQEG